MARVHVPCHNCGSLLDIEVNQAEKSELLRIGYIFRFCSDCREPTRHDLPSDLNAHEEMGSSVRTMQEEKPPVGRVLVIDDDSDIRTVLRKMLVAVGYEVVQAETGRDALSLLARGDFDAILSDVRMPELDGPSLFQFLQQHLPEAKNRVIFVTGDTSNQETMIFLSSAGRPYLPKPINLAQLLALVESVIATAPPVTRGDS